VKKPSLDEASTIAQLKQGDINGMEWLVITYQVQAVSAAYFIVRDQKTAEDVVQQSFLHAAQKIQQFDESKSFGPWFLRIVINASLRVADQQKVLVPLEKEGDDNTAKVAAWLLDPHPRPDEIIETEETRQMVWDAMCQLTSEQRAVIIMRHFLEMTDLEITRALDRPKTTVRWRLRTARNRLKELLRSFREQDCPELKEERQEQEND
jgi:RNA polymerase sigma-70 factor (ECF subfamily)